MSLAATPGLGSTTIDGGSIMAIFVPPNKNGGKIPNERSKEDAMRSCYHCGKQHKTAAKATVCESSHEK